MAQVGVEKYRSYDDVVSACEKIAHTEPIVGNEVLKICQAVEKY
jgi:hypothetical protein